MLSSVHYRITSPPRWRLHHGWRIHHRWRIHLGWSALHNGWRLHHMWRLHHVKSKPPRMEAPPRVETPPRDPRIHRGTPPPCVEDPRMVEEARPWGLFRRFSTRLLSFNGTSRYDALNGRHLAWRRGSDSCAEE